MRKFLIVAACLFLTGVASSANAMTYFLKKDLGVRDQQRLCLYTNNKIYSVQAMEFCPNSVEDNDITAGTTNRVPQTGFKSGEYLEGTSKICVYSVMGRTERVRFNSYELCPLSYEF